MTKIVLRKELHTMIDTLPDPSLPIIKTFLDKEYWKPVIEPASPEECAMVEERVKDYESNPKEWASIREIKRRRGR